MQQQLLLLAGWFCRNEVSYLVCGVPLDALSHALLMLLMLLLLLGQMIRHTHDLTHTLTFLWGGGGHLLGIAPGWGRYVGLQEDILALAGFRFAEHTRDFRTLFTILML